MTDTLTICARAIAEAQFHGWTLERVFRVAASEDGDSFDEMAFGEVIATLARACLQAAADNVSQAMIEAGYREADRFGMVQPEPIFASMCRAIVGEKG